MEDIEQLSLFDDILPEYKITKPVRLISFFSGIEAQFKALSFIGKYLNVPVESYKTCEWAYNSIIGCNAIHNRDFTDYSLNKTKEELIDAIRGISVDYNQPLTDEQLNKKPLSWVRKAYNNCIANHNLLNIMNVKGGDLEIVDTDKYEYILTYSFPCQDLSLAGNRAGMSVSQADGGTRSGLLWEVERILGECETKPQILVMENVPAIHSEKDMPNFRKWIHRLEELGYTSFYDDLNAKDYGIPQNRDRCFMVSILGKDLLYKFPRKIGRKYNLKDFLQDNVDEKYYLSQKMVDYCTGINQRQSKYDRGSRFLSSLRLTNEDNVAGCITTAAGQRVTDNFILDDIQVVGNYMPSGHNAGRVVNPKGIAPAVMENHGTVTAILEDKSDSFVAKAYEEFGSVPEMFNPYNKTEIKDVAPTQTTQAGSTTSSATVLIRENTVDGYRVAHEGDGINISSRMKHQRGNVQYGMSQTLKTTCEVGTLEINGNTFRIRKLTEKEAGRLMGFQDIDTDRMKESGLGNSALFHVYGDSIVVCVLIGIFAKLFGVGQTEVKQIIEEYIETIKGE